MNTDALIIGAYLVNILLVSLFILLVRNLVLQVSAKQSKKTKIDS